MAPARGSARKRSGNRPGRAAARRLEHFVRMIGVLEYMMRVDEGERGASCELPLCVVGLKRRGEHIEPEHPANQCSAMFGRLCARRRE